MGKKGFLIKHSLPSIEKRDIDFLAEYLKGTMPDEGSATKAFEDTYGRYTGTRFNLATSSGTAALHLALLALGIGRGHDA